MRPTVQFLLFFCLLLLPSFAMAKTSKEALGFDIRMIYAENAEKAEISEGLETLQADLSSGFSGYNSFKLLQNSYHIARTDQPASLLIPSQPPASLKIVYLEKIGDDAYSIEVSVNEKLTAKLKLTPHATFFQAGIPFAEGILIIAVTLSQVTS